MVSSNSNTTASPFSVLFPSVDASVVTIEGEAALPVEAKASGEHTEVTALVAMAGGSTIATPLVTNSDVVDRDVDDELPVQEVATISKEAALGPDLAVLDSSVDCRMGSNISISMPINCSMKCPIILVGRKHA